MSFDFSGGGGGGGDSERKRTHEGSGGGSSKKKVTVALKQKSKACSSSKKEVTATLKQKSKASSSMNVNYDSSPRNFQKNKTNYRMCIFGCYQLHRIHDPAHTASLRRVQNSLGF